MSKFEQYLNETTSQYTFELEEYYEQRSQKGRYAGKVGDMKKKRYIVFKDGKPLKFENSHGRQVTKTFERKSDAKQWVDFMNKGGKPEAYQAYLLSPERYEARHGKLK